MGYYLELFLELFAKSETNIDSVILVQFSKIWNSKMIASFYSIYASLIKLLINKHKYKKLAKFYIKRNLMSVTTMMQKTIINIK